MTSVFTRAGQAYSSNDSTLCWVGSEFRLFVFGITHAKDVAQLLRQRHRAEEAGLFEAVEVGKVAHARKCANSDLLISDGCDWSGVIAKLFANSMRPTRKAG
jgi:hypothetical protein